MGCKIPNKTKTSKIISDFFGFLKNVIYICQCGNHPLTVDENSIVFYKSDEAVNITMNFSGREISAKN